MKDGCPKCQGLPALRLGLEGQPFRYAIKHDRSCALFDPSIGPWFKDHTTAPDRPVGKPPARLSGL